MNNKIKHLEMIENIIERMSKNCFQLKSWTMTLVAGISVFSSQNNDKRFILITLFPLFFFWILDSFYLQLERKYRLLYKHIIEKEEENIDFNLDLSQVQWTIDEMGKICFYKCLFSITEICFYPAMIISMIGFCYIFKLF